MLEHITTVMAKIVLGKLFLPAPAMNVTPQQARAFDEWASESAVKPIARIAVTPDDFPFLHKVAWHYESEPMLVSWLMFKRRVGTSEETIRRST